MSETRTRVAFFIDKFGVGGSELNAVRTAEALDPNRIDLRVFHFDEEGPLRKRYEALGVQMVHLPISGFLSWSSLKQGWRLARELRRWKAQVLHAHCVYTNIFSAPWASLLGGCRVIASRRWWHFSPRPGLSTANRYAYRLADRVLANTEAVAAMLYRDEHVPQNKVVTIHNFLDDTAFQVADASRSAAQRSAWGVPDGAVVIGIVARLHDVKNHTLLLEAFAQLDHGAHLVMVGDGPMRGSLEQLAANLGISKRVHFAGEVVSRENLHAHFDISVLCSHSEGFPNTIIEAMAVARPVVSTPVGGVVDVVQDGVTGLLAKDATAFASALRRLCNDAPLRERLGHAGQALVSSRYRRAKVIENLSALYESLARKTGH
jgi:glycosyltransferase involved in cell wall biosynthesis